MNYECEIHSVPCIPMNDVCESNKSMIIDLIKDVKEMYNHTSYDSYHDDEYGPPRYYVYVEELEVLEKKLFNLLLNAFRMEKIEEIKP